MNCIECMDFDPHATRDVCAACLALPPNVREANRVNMLASMMADEDKNRVNREDAARLAIEEEP